MTWIKENNKNQSKGQNAYMDICLEAKKYLLQIDEQIRNLIDN